MRFSLEFQGQRYLAVNRAETLREMSNCEVVCAGPKMLHTLHPSGSGQKENVASKNEEPTEFTAKT